MFDAVDQWLEGLGLKSPTLSGSVPPGPKVAAAALALMLLLGWRSGTKRHSAHLEAECLWRPSLTSHVVCH